MVSYSNKGDQFGGLLSNVSGVDSSAFQKKALKDVKAPNAAVGFSNPPSKGQARPAHGYADLSDMSRGQSNSQQGLQSASQRSSSASSASAAKSDRYVYNATAKDSSMQFGGILGDLDSSKHSRPMRKATEPVVRPPSAPKATPHHEAVSSSPFNNDLDDLFGVPARQQPPMSASPDADNLLAAFEDSSMSSSGPANPSASFSAPYPSANLQPASQSRTGHKPADDLLGGFEGSLGVEDHSTPEPVPEPEMLRQMHDTQAATADADDHLDIFAAPVGRSQDTGTLSSQEDAPADIDERTPKRPQSAGYQKSDEPTERRKVSQARPSPRQSSRAAPAQATEDEGRRASPPAGSNGNISRNSQDFDRHRQRPANAPKEQQGSTAAREEGHALGLANKDNAKEWLDKGQKWLLGAGKKLAAAAKEAQSTIQTKLEDMEVLKPSQGKGQMWSPSNDAEIPEYYRQWAAAIGRLSPEEQMRTLAQMSEEDRLIVQRLMDRSSMQASGAGVASRPEAPAAPSPDRAGRRQAEAPPQQRVRPGSSGDLRSQRRGSPAERGPARRSSSYNIGDRERDSSPEPSPASVSDAAPSQRSHESPARETPRPPVKAAEARQPEPEADFLGFSGPGEAPAPSARPQSKPAVTQASKATSAEPPMQSPHEDFLGMSVGVAPQPKVATPSSSDFLDVSEEARPQSGAADSGRPTAAAAQSEDDLLGGFSRAQPAAAAAAQPASGASTPHADIESLFGAQPASQHRAGASMIDFGEEAAPEAVAHVFASPGDVEVEGEPELRRQLRARRLAEKQAQMAAALAEKQARDVQESTEKERKVTLREEYKQRMAAWRQGKDGNIRALLASLDTVLWEDSGWKKPSMTDLVEPKRVKRAYMMANLVVHPDKVKQKGGTVEQIVVADIAFDTLKTAWAKFEAGELRS